MTDKQTLLTLAERIEGHTFDGRWDTVTDRNRELNEAIAVSRGLPLTQQLGDPALGNHRCLPARIPDYVGSVDAALTLVPDGCWPEGAFGVNRGRSSIEVHAPMTYDALGIAVAATPALALTAAALRAHAGAMS